MKKYLLLLSLCGSCAFQHRVATKDRATLFMHRRDPDPRNYEPVTPIQVWDQHKGRWVYVGM